MDTENTASSTGAAALEAMRRAASAAGQAAMAHFRRGQNTTARISYKTGGSPVTSADLEADRIIREALARDFPDAAVFSEEAAHEDERFSRRHVFVVDPIDGTRAFMQGRDEWCVSIALMEQGRPVAGVIHAPARVEIFEAASGSGARRNGVRLTPRGAVRGADILTAGPRPLLDRIARADRGITVAEPLRALAYRLAAVSSGAIMAAVAGEGAHDWDIAAADVILAETGCLLLTASGERPVYNAADPVHPALVAAPGEAARRLLACLAAVASA